MGNFDTYYLLQYMGFFPEVTNPVNVRIHGEAGVFHGDIKDHQFDSEGKLISYVFEESDVSIVWNCIAKHAKAY